MSDKNSSKDKSSKNEGKETGYNLVQTIMNDKNTKDMNQPQNNRTNLPIPPYQNFNKNSNGQISSESNNNKESYHDAFFMQDMKIQIQKNSLDAIKKLLETKRISERTKNILLNVSFNQLYLTNSNIQKQIIVELIKHGANPEYKLNLSENKKSNNYPIPTNIKLTPLIYCCIQGDYELFELIKNKLNLSTSNDENPLNKSNKNYFFYFFENNQNVDNKYKIANSIFQKAKENGKIKINVNDIDKQTGMTLLMLSVFHKFINFIKLFLENGADINLQNSINGDTALHYAARIGNKKIIEILLEDKNCDLLIINNKKENVVKVATINNANTEIYSLLAEKYGEQKKLLEEKNNQKNGEKNKINKNGSNVNGSIEKINTYKISNNNNSKNNKPNDNGNENDILETNQIKKSIEDFNSYIEIPFQFANNPFNYVEFYDSNNKNKIQNGINEVEINSISNSDENESGSIKNYVKLKGAPILNINLRTKEDEDALILDNLKAENEDLDTEYETIENKLDLIYKEHNKLLKELYEVNSELKSVNEKIDSYNKKMQEKESKYIVAYEKLKAQESNQNSILDVLLYQKKFLEMNNEESKYVLDMNYLNNKFAEDYLDDKTIKINLQKDILDFQQYVKANIKIKQKPINDIRSSIQEILESNGYDYTVYVFGSYATGLCLPWSDLDLILISKSQSSQIINSSEKLKEIFPLLSNENWINKPTLVTNYRVFPYITFSTDESHGFMKVNITIQDKKNNGYKCAKLTEKFLTTYKNIEPLVLVIKHLLKYANTLFSLSGYSENQKEKLNSYSIILMVVFFIQFQIMHTNIEIINNRENLAELFMSFLVYYNKFDQNEKGFIFVRTGLEDTLENSDFLKLKESNSKLVVIDPLDHKSNVLDKDVDFNNYKFFFKLILYSARIKCDCSCHYLKDYNDKNGNDGNKSIELGTEHCILKKIFKTANRINSNLLSF